MFATYVFNVLGVKFYTTNPYTFNKNGGVAIHFVYLTSENDIITNPIYNLLIFCRMRKCQLYYALTPIIFANYKFIILLGMSTFYNSVLLEMFRQPLISST